MILEIILFYQINDDLPFSYIHTDFQHFQGENQIILRIPLIPLYIFFALPFFYDIGPVVY